MSAVVPDKSPARDSQVSTPSEKSLITEVRDHVLIMTINRPQVRNAMDQKTARAIGDAIELLESDNELRVGVITGAGGTFCSGMDLKAFVRGERPVDERRGFAGLVQKPPTKPLIAAAEGWALAGGCEIALACDLIVAGESAQFGIPEVKRGLAAAGGGLLRLPQRLPVNLAMELAITGEPLGAARAHELGLVNRLTPTGEALEVALELASLIAGNAPRAVRAAKQVIQESRTWSDDEGFERQEPIVRPVQSSEDAQEGARAFNEKRAPRWTGR